MDFRLETKWNASNGKSHWLTLKTVGLFLLFRFSYKEKNGFTKLKRTFFACWATISTFAYLSLKYQIRRIKNQISYFIFVDKPWAGQGYG